MKLDEKCALIIVDPQNDFCKGGRLAVPGGDAIMGPINHLSLDFRIDGGTIVITQDWHPNQHNSFASSHDAEPFTTATMPYGDQTLWPDHCVQGTYGAAFHPEIEGAIVRSHCIIRKGFHKDIDSYSAFVENDKITQTGLTGYLRERGITKVYLVGLAYDYCVGYSALDAVAAGFEAVVIKNLTRSIAPESEAAMDKLFEENGVKTEEYNDGV